jgi:PAS domain-containing protein
MQEVKHSDHQEIIILNRILAAQSTLQVFDKAVNLGDFVACAIQSVPGIKFVELTLRSEILTLEKAESLDNQNFYSLVGSLGGKYLPPVVDLPGNEILFQLKTFKTTFGFLKISISDPFLFRKYEPAVRNLLNVCALQLENSLHSKIAGRYKGHLEELVEEKTAELQNEIDEKNEQAEKLRESEERFRTLVENVDDIIYTMDKTGRFTYVSPKWEKWMGHRPEEVIGTTIESYVHPEDMASVSNIINRFSSLKRCPRCLNSESLKKTAPLAGMPAMVHLFTIKAGMFPISLEYQGILPQGKRQSRNLETIWTASKIQSNQKTDTSPFSPTISEVHSIFFLIFPNYYRMELICSVKVR